LPNLANGNAKLALVVVLSSIVVAASQNSTAYAALDDITIYRPTYILCRDVNGMCFGPDIAVKIANNNNARQPYLLILQVTDSEGYTTSVQVRTGTLEASTTASITFGPTFEIAGEHEIKIFAIDSFENVEFLSNLSSSIIDVR
jgi:hypothetical protein